MGNLNDLREAVVNRLESVPAVAGVPVVPEDRGDIDTEIRKALASAGGLVITVGTGNAVGSAPNSPTPQAEVEIVVEVGEQVTINRGAGGAHIPAIDLAVVVVCALHHYAWEAGKTLVFDRIGYNSDDRGKLVIYTCIFKTHVTFSTTLGE